MPKRTRAPKCMTDQVRGHTFLPNFLNRTGKVIDLGMNKAAFATVMRDRYGCSVAGLEANAALAEANASLNGITCKHAAISGTDGSVEFFVNRADSEASKIVPFSERGAHTISVPSLSLATFFRETDTDEADLLKVDVEGAELDLIEKTPADEFLRCGQITVEFHAFVFPEQAPRVETAINRMSEIGFYPLDFSIRRTDVLFVNRNVIDLSAADKFYLLSQKYRDGIKRRLHRFTAQN